MKISILTIGKRHDPRLLNAINDYTKRLQHYTKIEWKLLEAKISASMSEMQIKAAESEIISARISEEDVAILLDEKGTQVDTPAVAQKVQNYMNSSTKNIVFINYCRKK